MTKNRIEAFSKGVFSIVITLMAFDIKLSSSSTNLARALDILHPKMKGYVLSFAIVGVYWIAHHHIFRVLRRADRSLMWLNLVFLLSVTLLPFTTSPPGASIGT